MKLVILGMPGAGKGTQSVFIKDFFSIPHISTGDMLRGAVEQKTDTGLQAASYINAGKFVPDKIVLDIVSWRLSEPDCKNGFLLDGFPRNLAQAEALDKILSEKGMALDRVINLKVSSEEVVRRLSSRKICSGCAKILNTHSDKCEFCGGALIVRSDDKEEVVRERLRVYDEQTAVLVEYYASKGTLLTADASGTPEEVWENLKKNLVQ